MAEKTKSKHLINLENHFSATDPLLLKASKTFHELDQLEFDLGLIDDSETTARKNSWWPIVSLIGGESSVKSEFIGHYLNSSLQTSSHKFSVYQYSPQLTELILPGTALDADHRLPFYQISKKLEQISQGEGSNVNSFLELQTVNNDKIKGNLFIDTPSFHISSSNSIQLALHKHVLNISDLVIVFTDFFDAQANLIQDSIDEIVSHQNSNKFLYIIDRSEEILDANGKNEIIASWQSRLADLNIHTGQFIVLSKDEHNPANSAFSKIEERLIHIEIDRSYRVLNTLEKNIQDINDVYIPEVENHLAVWKEKSNMSTLLIFSFIMALLIFAEIFIGVSDLLLDHIIGPSFLLMLIGILVPMHFIMAKVHAKVIVTQLQKRQQKLDISENLSGLFEQSLTFWRTLRPSSKPLGKNKDTGKQIKSLIEKTKSMVQELNDQFSFYQQEGVYSPPAELNLTKK